MEKWKCTVCGRSFEGAAPPPVCPVCGALESAFVPLAFPAAPAAQGAGGAFVLVGGGVAALEAARAIRRRNAGASITLVTGENRLPYSRPGLPGIITGEKSFEDLLLEDEAFFASSRIEVLRGAAVSGIDPCAHTVLLSGQGSIPYTKLLLATGAKPFCPIKYTHGSVPVRVLRTYEDAQTLAETACGQRILLVGGGILGLEAAVALTRRGAGVTVLEYAPRILPLQTDEAVSAMLEQRLAAMGIGLCCSSSVSEALREGALTADGRELPADCILASMGVRSEVGLAVTLGLELGRGIVVDEHMRTSRADIWAAGDCAEYGGRVPATAVAARAMGEAAGASMAGDESCPYTPVIPSTFFTLPDFSLFSAGALDESAPDAETVCRGGAAGGRYRKLVFREGRLAGALFVGGGPTRGLMRALAQKAPLQEALALLA